MTDDANRFAHLVAQLAGEPVPVPTTAPGRVIKAPPAPDIAEDAIDLEHADVWAQLLRTMNRGGRP